VRIIRDNKTGIGKGIGYVTFTEPGSVNLALKLNSVEVNERKIRVERCSKKQKVKKTEKKESTKKPQKENKLKTKNDKDKRPRKGKKRKQVSTNLKEIKRVRI
jgi:nucleolar protein 12